MTANPMVASSNDGMQNRPVRAIYDRATPSMVLGIVGIAILWIPFFGWIAGLVCAILAIVFGKKTRQEYDAAAASGYLPVKFNKMPVNRGQATAGFTMGWITVGLNILWVIFWISVIASGNS